jgi:hypothetical protein
LLPRAAPHHPKAAGAAGTAFASTAKESGHSSITLTLDTYSHVMRELREQAVAAQTSMLGG